MTDLPPNRDKRTKSWRRKSTYSIWSSMIERCTNPDHHGWYDYGYRGITVQEDWLPSAERPRLVAFANFVRDIGLRPSQYLSLDRKRVNEGYNKDNCKWATGKEQGRNKRTTIYVPDPDDLSKQIPAVELAERLNISYQQLRYRLVKAKAWPGNT